MSDVRLQVVDPDAKFTCGGCTKCCTQPYAVIIEKDKAEALGRHDFSAYPQLAGRTWYRESKDAPAGYHVLSKREGTTRCLFLADDGLCIIHKELGPQAKPRPCLKFPYHVSPTFVDDRVSLDFGCPNVQSAAGRQLVAQAEEIAETCSVSKVRVHSDAIIEISAGGPTLNHDEYEALLDRLEAILTRPGETSLWSRFAASLALVQAVAELKRGIGDDLSNDVRDGTIAGAVDAAEIAPYDSAPKAPSPVRMMFAATLLRDVLPPDVTLSMGLWGRVKLLPRLMSLAKLSGRYESKFLGREVDIDAVLAHPLDAELDAGANGLLQRYFRTRIWQRFLVGTRLSIIAGLHQHIQDFNAILFLARAEAQHRREERLSEPLVAQALSHVELNIANQPRVFDQKALTWFTGQLDSAVLALESLRLMSLPGEDSAERSVLARDAALVARR